MGAILKLRDYQEAAVDAVYQYWADGRGENPLVVAPTGSGKTAIIAKLVSDAMSFPGTRVLILAHVKELLEQGAKGLLRMYPEADFGFYSASIGQKRLDKPITFAGIQSVWTKAHEMIPPPDLVLIDEAHMVPKNSETRYGQFLAALRVCNPDVKLVGLTATEYRLDSGYLHKGDGAIFDGIAYSIPVGMLMDKGYLSTVISKGGARKIDLTDVHMRGGEFIESELAAAASDPELVASVAAEVVDLGKGRKAWLIFASGLAHAAKLRDAFALLGVDMEVVSGEDGKTDRARKLSDFTSGRRRGLINCDILTTGFDYPGVDLVALVRATASAGLYVQMVGRGTRIAEGKENCLILDYGDNVARHGFIDAVKPTIKGQSKGGDAPTKECDVCQTICHAAVRVCPECGGKFPEPEANHNTRAYSGALLSTQVQAEWHDVTGVSYGVWKKEGKPDSIRVTYNCGPIFMVSEWLCPDHGGYAASRYKARMPSLGAKATTTAEAIKESFHWNMPYKIKVKPNGKYHEIVQLDYVKPKEAKAMEDWTW